MKGKEEEEQPTCGVMPFEVLKHARSMRSELRTTHCARPRVASLVLAKGVPDPRPRPSGQAYSLEVLAWLKKINDESTRFEC